MSKYLVVNENTLCYAQEGTVMLGVLTGSVLRGGRDWKNGAIFVAPSDKVRPATEEDFESYRVCLPPDFK